MRELAEGAASRAQVARDRLAWVEVQRRRLAGGDRPPAGDGLGQVEGGILESVE